ncbi:hypothetical protein Haur_5129 (plasmid) [Herpetosiphon aurantiacus DSM 785]|uniref:Uncharacterized protein n=1 Tax=Herpetosiphon aurantiacus (strain ATCC 23779 / DSM 785 / 114-95) TaxID=316274 RepID=A9B8U3_HERA2|nr:hypothetical protein Haur_5129 [Herpetosiphon aurantiacus DSM 785]
MLYPPHIIVTVSLYPSGQSVYPLSLQGTDIQFRYGYPPHDWFCCFYGESDQEGYLMPGETTIGGIEMFSPDAHFDQFWVGMPFQLAYGQSVIADGIILDVVDLRMLAPTPSS